MCGIVGLLTYQNQFYELIYFTCYDKIFIK